MGPPDFSVLCKLHAHRSLLSCCFFLGGGGVGRLKIARAGYADRAQFLANNFLQNKDSAKIRPPSCSACQCASNDHDALNYYVK